MECTDQHRPMNTTLYKFQAEFLKLRRKAHKTGRPWNEWNINLIKMYIFYLKSFSIRCLS